MSAEHSKACCIIPAVISKGYEEKGTWTTINGMRTYTTGPASAKKAILHLYDVFAYTSQTFQGADIVAANGYLVIMPDWFLGSSVNIADFPPKNDEEMKKMRAVLDDFSPHKTVPRVGEIVAVLKQQYPHVATWGVLGFCWGGKVVALTSGAGTPFAAAVQSSPGRLDPADAETCTIPMAVLASKDEDPGVVKKFGAALPVEKQVEVFETQVHGWMSARADLEDAKCKAEYERGYQMTIDFFNAHL